MGVVSHMLAVTEVLIELPKLLWGDTPSDDNGYNMHKKNGKPWNFAPIIILVTTHDAKKLRLILTMTYMEVGRLAVVAYKTCSSSLGWLRHVTSSFGSET